eukprot:GEZU01012980.1.p1 GENE.GEZU01012980.1~~GEZU01012980.1.p1  ORF type:complete len:301 (+),score=46.39 GEZU01012980.1:795-1697(+)
MSMGQLCVSRTQVRLQTQGTTGLYRGPIDCLKKTVAKEGISALFKGMASPLAGVAAVNAVLFAAYGEAKRFLLKRRSENSIEDELEEEAAELTTTETIIAGSFAGLANCIVICPVELIKSKLQVQTLPSGAASPAVAFKGPLDVIKKVYAQQGVRGLFKGMSATIYREVPAYGAYFGCYSLAKQLITPEGSRTSDLGPLSLFIAGGIGGVGCWVFSYPQDLVKSRLQVQQIGEAKYKPIKWLFDGGFFDCARQIYREEGARGFWVGFSPTIIRAFWANACTFVAYEFTMKMLNAVFDDVE